VPPSTTFSPGQPPIFVAVDGSGNVYIEAGGYPHVYVYIYPYGSSGSAYGTDMVTTLTEPGGMAVDAAGNVYITDVTTNTLNVFANPGTSAGIVYPTATRVVTPGFIQAGPLAVDSTGRVYVLDSGVPDVQIFAAGTTNAASASALETIQGSGAFPYFVGSPAAPSTLALDSSNNLYVTDYSTIQIFKASAITGALGGPLTTPSNTIAGAATLLNQDATGIAVH